MVRDKRQKARFKSEMEEFVTLVKKHERIPPRKVEESWHGFRFRRIAAEAACRRRILVRRWTTVCAAAACIAALCLLYLIYTDNTPDESLFLAELENVAPTADSDEVVLVLSEQQQIALKDNSDINYDASGCVTVNNESPQIAGESADKESKEEKEHLNRLIVPRGKRTHLTLSDGTKIYVNSATRLVYPATFRTDRRVIAVYGEAYLEVAHNAKAPFIVKTKGMEVKVLGTTFNVNAYEADNTAVVLVEGRVEVNTDSKHTLVLEPSQMAHLKDGVLNKAKVDVEKYICWKDNVMLIERENVCEILQRVARYYGVTVTCDPHVAPQKLSGKLNLSESIDNVLEVIRESASIRMEKTAEGKYHFY